MLQWPGRGLVLLPAAAGWVLPILVVAAVVVAPLLIHGILQPPLPYSLPEVPRTVKCRHFGELPACESWPVSGLLAHRWEAPALQASAC
eukprot:6346123-Prorocentrum_lima.AAC.1